jgi:predicted alpha/beta-hydrolase family hydrolase
MQPAQIEIATAGGPLPGLWLEPADAAATVVLAHGAGSGMRTPFMAGVAEGLAAAGVATLRFEFPYMAAGRKPPDRPPRLLEAWQAAFAAAADRSPTPPLAGGKSMGGRIASMAAAEGMPASGLVFLGYPLHPPGRPERLRDEHLAAVTVPMLFIQGDRDPFARPDLLHAVIERLGDRARLVDVPGGDHSLRVSGRPRDAHAIGAALADPVAAFAHQVLAV